MIRTLTGPIWSGIVHVARWSGAHLAALCWVAFVLAVAVVVTLRPGWTGALYAVEIGVAAALWLLVALKNRQYGKASTERLRAEVAEERRQISAMRDAVHEHYLDAIRDREMPAAAYGRASRLAELVRHLQFPDIYPAPEVEHEPSDAQLDRQVKADTFAGYGPDGEIER